jgi:pterin-4a-carbinolamine dehydratase
MQQFVVVQSESRLRRVVRPFFRKLKPERVQEELRTMPGWILLPNGKVIQRTYQLSSDRAAANFATYLSAHAGDMGQPANLTLAGRTLTVKLFAPLYRGRLTALDMGVIAFARQLN